MSTKILFGLHLMFNKIKNASKEKRYFSSEA